MSVKTIPCFFDQQFILFPDLTGQTTNASNLVLVGVTITEDPLNGKTGVVHWSGSVRAFLTFDPSGSQVISYTMAVNDHESQRSIENILAHIH